MGVTRTTGPIAGRPREVPHTRTLGAIAMHPLEDDTVYRDDLGCGDRVIVATCNSVYSLCSVGDGTFVVNGGWFDRSGDSPAVVAVSGCTYGGTVIRTGVVAARGLFLEFGNGVLTTRIQRVGLVRRSDRAAALA